MNKVDAYWQLRHGQWEALAGAAADNRPPQEDLEVLVRAMARSGDFTGLRAAGLSRHQIRQWVAPEIRARQGEIAQIVLPFRTNWVGTGLMSRYAA